MVSIYELKPRFQALLRPCLAPLRRVGCTPNAITVFALCGSLLVGATAPLAAEEPRWLVLFPAWLLVRMALNALDGMMARELGLASRLGAILNELGDVLSDVALYLPLALVVPASAVPVVLFVLGALITEFAGVLAQALAGQRRYEGPMGKSDRAFWVGALTLVSAFLPGAARAWPAFFLLAAALAVPTSIRRLRPLVQVES